MALFDGRIIRELGFLAHFFVAKGLKASWISLKADVTLSDCIETFSISFTLDVSYDYGTRIRLNRHSTLVSNERNTRSNFFCFCFSYFYIQIINSPDGRCCSCSWGVVSHLFVKRSKLCVRYFISPITLLDYFSSVVIFQRISLLFFIDCFVVSVFGGITKEWKP